MNKVDVDCQICVHRNVCKHKENMADEVRKFKQNIKQPPVTITISCDEFKLQTAINRGVHFPPKDFPGDFTREVTTGDPLHETITYTTDNTRPRTV